LRNERIDFLRFLGLCMIILAHVDPSDGLFQLRNFDVPLMVLISGVSFGLSYKGEPYGSYVWKRVKRLLLPVWIFLTGYYLVLYLTEFPTPLPDKTKVIATFMLLIGYVWIIRVFLLVALLSPFIYKQHTTAKTPRRYFILLAAVFVVNELLLWQARPYLETRLGQLLGEAAFSILPYAVLFGLGLRLPSMTKRQLVGSAAFFTALFGVLAFLFAQDAGRFVQTQDFKNPPSMYYFSYALAVSFVAWLTGDFFVAVFQKVKLYGVVKFIAQNSFWIYLWHIPFLDVYHGPWIKGQPGAGFKYTCVFLTSALIVLVQVNLVRKVILPRLKSKDVQKNVNILFTG